MPGASCGSSSCFDSGVPSDASGIDVSTDIGNSDATQESPMVNALCGTGCLPDDPYACGAGGSSGGIEDAGADGDESEASGEALDGASDTSSYNKVPSPFPSPEGGSDVLSGGACQVTSTSSGEPVSACAVSGTGEDNDPCVSSADCAPGFTCVGDESTGVCSPYCCASAESCAAGTWCTVRSSRDALMQSPPVKLSVPVCVHSEDCVLLPKPGAETCPQGTVCTVVRNDGTLACLPPGTQGDGETCDNNDLRCAEGFVCSRATMTCLRLCHTDSDECGSGVCQAGSTGLPENIGICVGNRS